MLRKEDPRLLADKLSPNDLKSKIKILITKLNDEFTPLFKTYIIDRLVSIYEHPLPKQEVLTKSFHDSILESFKHYCDKALP